MLSNISAETEIAVYDIEQSQSTTLFIGTCTHSYSNLTTKQKPFIAYLNFVLKSRTKEFTAQSFNNGNDIFINDHQAYSRDLLLLFESDIVGLRASFMGFGDTLNSFSDRQPTPRVKSTEDISRSPFLHTNGFNLICSWGNRYFQSLTTSSI